MLKTRQWIAAALIGAAGLGLSVTASAHGGEGRGWGGDRGEWYQPRHHHHHGGRGYGPGYYAPQAVYMAPPPMVYERPIVYAPQPVYAYPSRPSVVVSVPPLVFPLR